VNCFIIVNTHHSIHTVIYIREDVKKQEEEERMARVHVFPSVVWSLGCSCSPRRLDLPSATGGRERPLGPTTLNSVLAV